MKCKQIISYIAMILDIVIVWAYMFFIDALYFMLVIQALLPIIIVILQQIKMPKYVWIIFTIGIIFAIISTVYNHLAYEKLFLYISLLTHVLLYKYLILQEREFFWFILINTCFAYTLIISFFPEYLEAEKLYYYRNLITGRVINPNHYAIYSVFTAVLSVICLDLTKIKKVIKYILSYSVLIIFLTLIFISKSRTSLIALIIFTFLFTLKKFRFFESVKSQNLVGLVCLIGSFAVILAYLLLYKVSDGSFMIFGKDFFSGRQIIWMKAFEELKSSWFLGFAHPIINNGVSYQMHNGLLEVLCYFGIVPFLVLISLFIFRTKEGCKCNKLLLFGFIAICFINAFENLLITSYSNMVLITFLFCRTKIEQKIQTEKNLKSEPVNGTEDN